MNDNNDTPAAMLWGGILAPGALVSLVVLNLLHGKAYWPSRGPDPIAVYTGLQPVTGIILIELGAAGALCSWYLLSNLEQTQPWAWLGMTGSLIAVVGGFVLFIGNFL